MKFKIFFSLMNESQFIPTDSTFHMHWQIDITCRNGSFVHLCVTVVFWTIPCPVHLLVMLMPYGLTLPLKDRKLWGLSGSISLLLNHLDIWCLQINMTPHDTGSSDGNLGKSKCWHLHWHLKAKWCPWARDNGALSQQKEIEYSSGVYMGYEQCLGYASGTSHRPDSR